MTLRRLSLAVLASGCAAPHAHLSFPTAPVSNDETMTWFDTDGNGKRDFAIERDSAGNVDVLDYDDDEDGQIDRRYRPSDYPDASVPHLIVLLDSIPYQSLLDYYQAGGLRMFGRPQKVIPPFPSLTEICYTSVLRAPPLPGMVDEYYDPRRRRPNNGLWQRLGGYEQPWERRLHYGATFFEGGLAFLHPREWYAGELERAHRALDESPDPVSVVYLWSAAPMVCKFGRDGVKETLDGAQQLCLQLLYERHGAIKITLMSDHGHNLTASKNIPIDAFLRDAGLHVGKTIDGPDDVVPELAGLVTYAAVQTTRPKRVAEALLPHSEIELVMYLEGDRVLVRSSSGTAAIECRDRKLRYVAVDHDVLGYQPVVDSLAAQGKLANGFASDDDWFPATLDHEYPDAPRRIWDAFHGTAVNPPRVMFTTHDGWCAGLPEFEKFIKMASTHGSLNQVNSATFVMSMTRGRLTGPLRSCDVLGHVQPGFEPRVRLK